MKQGFIIALSVLGLAACGVDTLTTAATVATMKAEEGTQAQKHKQELEKKIKAANTQMDKHQQELDDNTP